MIPAFLIESYYYLFLAIFIFIITQGQSYESNFVSNNTELILKSMPMCICRRELRKSSISGNAYAIEELPELPRQLGKFFIFLLIFIYLVFCVVPFVRF